jgi:membrane-associated protease RseP (regulator of RpoE activity)
MSHPNLPVPFSDRDDEGPPSAPVSGRVEPAVAQPSPRSRPTSWASATETAALPPIRPNRIQVALFAATIVSTLTMYPLVQGANPFTDVKVLQDTLLFSATLLTILGLHELAHFAVGRFYSVDVSLPYFIPAPNLLGTFGAVIRIRSAIHHRRALLMIGAAGPIAGFVAAVPAVILGVAQSQVQPLEGDLGLLIGAPPIFGWIIDSIHGDLGPDRVLSLSGMAFAGWAGLFLTAFNLLPLGQLDGGHVVYALFGRRTLWVSLPVLALLIVMGSTLWIGWLVVGLLVLVFGLRHPPVSDPLRPLGRLPMVIALIALLVFLICFTPVPIFVA